MIPRVAVAAAGQVIPRWHMAGWSSEVGEQPLARRLANQSVVMFRVANGDVAALRDRCPHRFAPPSRGTRDHWLDMRWNGPVNMYLQIGATLAGRPRDEGIIVHQLHALCPETSDSSHYFWASTAAVSLTAPPVAAAAKALFDKAFDEEAKPTIEAAYRNIEGGEFWEQKPVFLGVDAGGLRARRVLQQIRNSVRGVPEDAVSGESGSR